MRDERSEKAQQCPKNVVSPSSSHLALTQKYFLTLFLLLLFQNIIANLVEFPLVGKLLLWVQQGACGSIWVEEAPARSQIQGMVKFILLEEHSGLAREACDVAVTQNHHPHGLERGLVGGN